MSTEVHAGCFSKMRRVLQAGRARGPGVSGKAHAPTLAHRGSPDPTSHQSSCWPDPGCLLSSLIPQAGTDLTLGLTLGRSAPLLQGKEALAPSPLLGQHSEVPAQWGPPGNPPFRSRAQVRGTTTSTSLTCPCRGPQRGGAGCRELGAPPAGFRRAGAGWLWGWDRRGRAAGPGGRLGDREIDSHSLVMASISPAPRKWSSWGASRRPAGSGPRGAVAARTAPDTSSL